MKDLLRMAVLLNHSTKIFFLHFRRCKGIIYYDTWVDSSLVETKKDIAIFYSFINLIKPFKNINEIKLAWFNFREFFHFLIIYKALLSELLTFYFMHGDTL